MNNEPPQSLESIAAELRLRLKILCAKYKILQLSDCPFEAIAKQIESHAQKQSELPRELFDGNAVLAEVRTIEGSSGRTSAENVSDVLDAVVRLIRINRSALRSESKGAAKP